jgi:hypothetical protein
MGLFTLYQCDEARFLKGLSVEVENLEGDALLQNMESKKTNSLVVEVHHDAVVIVDNRSFSIKVSEG